MKIKEICKGYGGMLTGCRWEYILMVEVWWSSVYGGMLTGCRWEYILMVEVWWSSFMGRCCSCVRKRVGKGGGWWWCGMFLIIPDCVSIYGSGAEVRYPGVVFFPLGGSVSWRPGPDVFCVKRVRCLLSVRCVRSPWCVCRWDWLRDTSGVACEGR